VSEDFGSDNEMKRQAEGGGLSAASAKLPDDGGLERELTVAKTLLSAAAALSAEIELDRLLERLAGIAVEATGIPRAFVNLIDLEQEVLIPKIAIGGLNAPTGAAIPLANLSETSLAAIRARETRILDYERPDTPEKDRSISSANNARLVLFIPLIFKGQVTGHISLDEPGERHDFTDTQIKVAQSIAAHAAIAVENARMFEQTKRTNETLAADLAATTTLHTVSATFVQAGGLEPVLERIVESAIEITGADMGHLQLLDPETGCLRIAASRGLDEGFHMFWDTAEHGRGPCAASAETRQRVVIEDVEASLEYFSEAELAIERAAGVRSIQSTPLISASGRLLGMVTTHFREPTSIDAQRLQYVDVLARQAADMIAWNESERALREASLEVESERARLRLVIDEIPIGVALVGPDGAVLEANDANRRLWGGVLPMARSVEEYSLYEGIRHGTGERLAPEDWPAPRAIETGVATEDLVDFVRSDGTTGIIGISATPILDDEGALARVVVVTQDVTELTRERELDEALAHIGERMGATLDEGQILRDLASISHTALGSEAARAVLSAHDRWSIAVSLGFPAELTRQLTPEESELTARAMDEGRVVTVQDVRAEALVESDPSMLSILGVPLVVQGAPIGALLFNHLSRPAGFSPSQVAFAKRIMHTASAALENARLYEREHKIAETLQEAILAPPVETDGLELGFLYRPASSAANVGGDFYDVVHTDSGRVAVSIGDVSGKGIEAARLTSLMRDGMRAYLVEDDDPGSVIRRLNTLAYRSTPTEMFATAFLAVLDPKTGLLKYCGAGHPSSLLLGPSGVTELASQSGLIGAFSEADFCSQQTVMGEDEVLVMITDGVTESRSMREMLDESGLKEIVGRMGGIPVAELPQRILDEVLAFSGGFRHDDIVIVAVKRSKRPPCSS